ncbi:MAG TPA: hypothetical protein VM580_34660, partial [Labilithrix sp.]|nr:hypothetical protein [Labilithrix sp.]
VVESALAQLRRLLVRTFPSSSSNEPTVPAAPDAGLRDTEGRVYPKDPLRSSHARALLWAARIALMNAPERAGATVCEVLPSIVRAEEYSRDYPRPRRVASAVLARSGYLCEAARAWIEAPPCGSGVVRDAGIYTRDEVAAAVDRWLYASDVEDGGAPRDLSDLPEGDLGLLGIAYTFGALDPEIVTRNARWTYTFEDAGASTKPCSTPGLDDGVPCACDKDVKFWMCATPASTKLADVGACRFRIDDARRRFTDTRRSCAAPFADCRGGKPCCGDAVCTFEDGRATCRPTPTLDVAH